MKKLIITMIAIAFSLSAFSIKEIDRYKIQQEQYSGATLVLTDIKVLCISDTVYLYDMLGKELYLWKGKSQTCKTYKK